MKQIRKKGEAVPEHGLPFAFCRCHDIIIFNLFCQKEYEDMTYRKTGKKQIAARIFTAVIAVIMVVSLVLTMVLK